MNLRALKYFCVVPPVYGLNIPAENYTSSGVRLLRTTDVGSDGRLRSGVSGVFVDPEQVPAKSMLRDGDLLLSRSGTLGRCLLFREASEPTTHAGYLVRFRPAEGIVPSYLAYCAQSNLMRDAIAAEAVESTIGNFNAEKYANVRLPWWPPATQQAIADYLDSETARIDALIGCKRTMLELLPERWRAVLGSVIWADVHETVPVMHLVDPTRPIMYGIVLPGPDVGGAGIPVVKGGDVVKCRLSPDELARTTPEIERPYARARLRQGDVLYAIRGGVGDVAVVPSELTGANITQDVARVAPRTDVRGDWLKYALQSPQAQADAESRITGATIRGLNIWELERLRLPLTSAERQDDDLRRLTREDFRLRKLRSGLLRQIQLLVERRTSLISAGVAGQCQAAADA